MSFYLLFIYCLFLYNFVDLNFLGYMKDNLVVSNPVYYHREYGNDLGYQEENLQNAEPAVAFVQRVALASLPFASLYKPFNFPLSLGLGVLRAGVSSKDLFAAFYVRNAREISVCMLQTAVATAALAGTIFAHPLGMAITTGQDLLLEVTRLVHYFNDGDYEKAMLSCANIINNALYLSLFFGGGIEMSIASLALQILLELYHSKAEFKKGHSIEAVGHLLMSVMRCSQLVGQSQLLQTQRKQAEEKRTLLQRKASTEKQQPSTLEKNQHQGTIVTQGQTSLPGNGQPAKTRFILKENLIENIYGVHIHSDFPIQVDILKFEDDKLFVKIGMLDDRSIGTTLPWDGFVVKGYSYRIWARSNALTESGWLYVTCVD